MAGDTQVKKKKKVKKVVKKADNNVQAEDVSANAKPRAHALVKSQTMSAILDKSNLDILDLGRIRKCAKCDRTHDSRVSCEEYNQKCKMVIVESIPTELPPDVVRCNSGARSDAGLDQLTHVNLTSLRSRFLQDSNNNNQEDIPAKKSPLDLNKYGLSRSQSVLLRLKRYQSIVTGEDIMEDPVPANGQKNGGDVTNTNGDHQQQEEVDVEEHESKQKEKAIPFQGFKSLKSQWESGVIENNNNNKDGDVDTTDSSNNNHVDDKNDDLSSSDVKDELYKLRQRICLGRSASMKQVYENGGLRAATGANMSLPTQSPIHTNHVNNQVNGKSGPGPVEAAVMEASKVKARKVRERFEKGQINNRSSDMEDSGSNDDYQEDKLSQLMREKLTDLSVVVEADTAAREAKKIFREMDKNLSAAKKESDFNRSRYQKKPTTTGPSNVSLEGEGSDQCTICGKVIYVLEKMEFGSAGVRTIHKTCFKCVHCMSSLRLDNYTLAAGKFYCLTHFKQLFMAKGNYDEGFGQEQHKDKWTAGKKTTSAGSASSDDGDH